MQNILITLIIKIYTRLYEAMSQATTIFLFIALEARGLAC